MPKPPAIAATHEISVAKQSLLSAELTPDGREVLVGGFAGVYTIDVATGKIARKYRDYQGNVVWSARMTRDGKRVVAGNGHCRLDIWDAKTKKRVAELESDDAIVTRLSLSRDGERAATAAGNNTLAFWDVAKGKKLGGTKAKKSFVIAAAITPDGTRAMHGGTDGVVRVFDCETEREIASSPGKGWIETIDCADDGTFASAGRDKTVMLWTADAQPIRTLRGLSRTITCVSLSPDGTRVAATGGKAMVWDAKTGDVLGTLPGDKIGHVRFSHDGKSIVTLGGGLVCIHEAP